MRKGFRLTIFFILILLLGGCGTIDDGSSGNNNNNDNITGLISDKPIDNSTFKAEIIEAGNTLIIAPDKESNEYKSSDKMSVNLTDCKITGINGEKIKDVELKAGDMIEITYNGMILESYPAQITASAINVTDRNLLIEGYLAIIDDIYQEDSGLNGDLEMIALDTTGWVNVTDIEKEIIFSKLQDIYGVDVVDGTYDKLAEEGLIDKDTLFFTKGILITISAMKYDKDKNVITYSIKKWRSGDGAVGTDDAKAKYDGTKWMITKENMWIS